MPKPICNVNPDCAAKLERTATILEQVVKDQVHMGETIYGNGKTGIKDLTEANTREIAELQKMIGDLVKSQRDAKLQKEEEAREKRSDIRRFWLQAAMTLIVSILAIAQTITIFLTIGK